MGACVDIGSRIWWARSCSGVRGRGCSSFCNEPKPDITKASSGVAFRCGEPHVGPLLENVVLLELLSRVTSSSGVMRRSHCSDSKQRRRNTAGSDRRVEV